MTLYRHYIVYDSEYCLDGDNNHFYDYEICEFNNIEEKDIYFYQNNSKLIAKNDYKKLILQNKECARIKIGFTYWSDEIWERDIFSEKVRQYLIELIHNTLKYKIF